ncbi:hypothetical protein ACFX2B_013853 [Malus domestica]
MALSCPFFDDPDSPHVYDVFLSFNGEDTRENFVDHLFAALEKAFQPSETTMNLREEKKPSSRDAHQVSIF